MPGTSSQEPRSFRRLPRIVAATAWCALIFAASHRPDLRIADDAVLDLVLRKVAHAVVFGVLALLLLEAIRGTARPGRGRLAAAWSGTLAYAASDEYHQTFVEGRLGQVSDVAIDMLGATVALAVRTLLDARADRSTEHAT